MSFKKVLGVGALLSVLALNFSCGKETVSETEELYGIDRKEIKDQDT